VTSRQLRRQLPALGYTLLSLSGLAVLLIGVASFSVALAMILGGVIAFALGMLGLGLSR